MRTPTSGVDVDLTHRPGASVIAQEDAGAPRGQPSRSSSGGRSRARIDLSTSCRCAKTSREIVACRQRERHGPAAQSRRQRHGRRDGALVARQRCAHLERVTARPAADATMVSPATSNPMSQPATLRELRIAPSMAPAASPTISVTDAESRNDGRAWRPETRVASCGRSGLCAESRVSCTRARWRRRSVRSASRRSRGEEELSASTSPCAAACPTRAARFSSWPLALGSPVLAAVGCSSRDGLAGMVPSLRWARPRECELCQHRGVLACMYADSPAWVRSIRRV